MLEALIVLLVVIAVILWCVGHPVARISTMVLIYIGVCVGAWYSAKEDNRWDVLVSVATALAVLTALFKGDIQKIAYRATIIVNVNTGLIDSAHNLLWIRGKVMNSGYRAVQRCRIKVLRIEGQPSRIENGYLQWQGGSQQPETLGSQEHLIFDIATRTLAQGSSVDVLSFIAGNKLTHSLNSGQTYELQLAVYGDNISTKMERVQIQIGAATNDIHFL